MKYAIDERHKLAQYALSTILATQTSVSIVTSRQDARVARLLLKMKYAEWDYFSQCLKYVGSNIGERTLLSLEKLHGFVYQPFDVQLVSSMFEARGFEVIELEANRGAFHELVCQKSYSGSTAIMSHHDMAAFAAAINKPMFRRNAMSNVGRAFLEMSSTDVLYITACLQTCLFERAIDRYWRQNRDDLDLCFVLPSRPVGLSLARVSTILSILGFRYLDHSDVSMTPQPEPEEDSEIMVCDICTYAGHALDECLL